MSRMMRISMMNDFIFNLSQELQDRIEDFVGSHYEMDDETVLNEFGLSVQFEEYIAQHAA